MDLSLLKLLYFYIGSITHEGKKIEIFKNKQDFESLFFTEGKNGYELLPAEETVQLREIIDNKNDGIII